MDFATYIVRTIADIFYNKPHTHATKDICKQVKDSINSENITDITKKVLKEMFCENTGSHICDSGGAYGYGYQRCQAIKDQNWDRFPSINVEVERVERYSDGEYYLNITKNTYQFLCEYLDYDIKMDEIFHKFCEQDYEFNNFNPRKETYCSCIDYFCKEHIPEILESEIYWRENTYNSENCLDKDLQYTILWIHEGEFKGQYMFLEVHNGCDIRGGYSTPHVFKLYDADEFLSMLQDLTCHCPNYDENYTKKTNGIQKTLDGKDTKDPVIDADHVDCYSDDAGYHWYGNRGSDLDEGSEYITDEEGNHKIICKKCGAELEFYW